MNKIFLVFALILIMGCRSKTKFIEKELIGAEIERISKIETKVEKRIKKDSVIQKKETEIKTDQSTNLHVKFDPKKNDSLEILHKIGKDSLRLKIRGNGEVSFDYHKSQSETSSDKKEIFGSETLFNLDSVVTDKSKQKEKTEKIISGKSVKETGFDFWIYVIAGGAVLLLIILFFLWKKFGGKFLERLKIYMEIP